MAEPVKTKAQVKTEESEAKLLAELKLQYDESEKDMKKLREDPDFSWDEREELLIGKLRDSGSLVAKSKVNTQDLTNLIFDGASRVMAQFPTGKFQAITKADTGKNLLMQLVHDKYIIPNANAQWSFMTKLKMWNVYSRVFGSMPALVDYRSDPQYIGPDFWLVHPRTFFPQAGCTNMNEMGHLQISTWVSVEWLEQRNKEVWTNIDELILKVKEAAKTKQQGTQEHLTVNERNRSDIAAATGKYASCELRTRYERGRWVTYSYDHDLIMRDIPNPQNNNELPVVMKHCFPLMDRLFGLGEFERGRTLQYAANSLVNMYLDSVKMSIYPPLIIDQNGVVASSIMYEAAAKWLTTKKDAITQLQLSPQGLNTFQSTYGFLKASILNLGATTDTAVTKDQDAGAGKTPQALRMQEAREGARDNWDRSMMEEALEQVYNRQIDLLVTKQDTPIKLTLFKKEIKELQKAYPDENILEVFDSGEAGTATINKEQWGENVKYRFYIDAGSTMKKDAVIEHESLVDIMALILKIPGAVDQIAKTGTLVIGDKTFNFGESLKRYIITSGVQDSEKIIYDTAEGMEPDEVSRLTQELEALKAEHQQMGQMVQQMGEVVQKLMAKPQKPNVAYKDAPEDVKRQLEMKDGLKPSQTLPNLADASQDSHAQAINYLQGQAAVAEPVPEESPIPNADPDVKAAVEQMQAEHISA